MKAPTFKPGKSPAESLAAGSTATRPTHPGYAPPPKRRRSPATTLAGIAIVLLAGLLGVLAYRSVGNGHDVVAARSTIHRGEIIGREDLITVRIGVDPALKPLAAGQMSMAVGKRAALDIAAGSMVTADSISAQLVPAAGASLIGVQLTSAQMPSGDLRAGDRVRLVHVPEKNQANTPTAPVTANVVSVAASTRGDARVVDVEIPQADAPTWAALAAQVRVVLVLETRER